MANELFIDSSSSGVQIALLKDKKLIELHHEHLSNNYYVGDVYLGQVKRLMPGLNAAFVNVGHERDAFLHYLDLGPQVKSLNRWLKTVQAGGFDTSDLKNFQMDPDIVKTGKVSEVLTKGANVLVQVIKEPIANKGPRISSELSLAGRYMVLVPFSNQISVSKKIKTFEERTRLKNLANSIRPPHFGVIIRTVAEGHSVAELHQDMLQLTEKWETLYRALKTAKPPQKVLGEMDRSASLLRDILNDNFSSITVNDPKVFDEIKSYVGKIAPQMESIVKLYNGKQPLFEQAGIEKQIKASFGKTVSMQGGAYLIIERTEAFHVIDVNSGSRTPTDGDQEANALSVNLDAAAEIARQLRLRDLGGIIVVDFIDQRTPNNRKAVFDRLQEEMSTDRAKHTILPMSKFGLVQITRQRVRPEVKISTAELCPTCKGTGEIGPSVLISDEIEQKLNYLISNLNMKNLSLNVHPYVASYFRQGIFSKRFRWILKYRTNIKVIPDAAYQIGEFRFFNEIGEEILLQ